MSFVEIYFLLVTFLFGACWGSFLNVCIHRIPRNKSIVKPRSHCPYCDRPIPWYDNIPLLSWILLGAKCRHCSQPISARYVLVELLTASIFLGIALVYGLSPLTPIYWLMATGLIMGTFIDFEHLIIPDRVTLGGIAAGLLLSVSFPILQATTSHWQALLNSLLGCALGWGLLWGVSVVGRLVFKKEAMGFGDVKLMGALGAFLGWQAIPFIVFFSSLFGSLVGVSLILGAKKELQSRIPYGPYIALAALIWVLGGSGWWQLYLEWVTSA